MKCVDNSYLDITRIEEAQKCIDLYREFDKEYTEADRFLERDLVVLETGLKVLKDACSRDNIREYGQSDISIEQEHVLQFIAEFLKNFGSVIGDFIKNIFSTTYRYYFAVMLKVAFMRGVVCFAYPSLDIVWVDNDNTAYDINGIYTDYDKLINVDLLGEGIIDYKHVPSVVSNIDPDELDEKVTCLALSNKDLVKPATVQVMDEMYKFYERED